MLTNVRQDCVGGSVSRVFRGLSGTLARAGTASKRSVCEPKALQGRGVARALGAECWRQGPKQWDSYGGQAGEVVLSKAIEATRVVTRASPPRHITVEGGLHDRPRKPGRCCRATADTRSQRRNEGSEAHAVRMVGGFEGTGCMRGALQARLSRLLVSVRRCSMRCTLDLARSMDRRRKPQA